MIEIRLRSELPRWAERLSRTGTLPGDSEDLRARKSTLVLAAAAITALSTIWVTTYAALGHYTAAAIPLAYQIASILSLAAFHRFKRFPAFRSSQLFLFVLLPFLLQWTLGGFVASGAVMLWAVLAPFGALMLSSRREALGWLGLYVALTIVSGAWDSSLAEDPEQASSVVSAVFFVLNVVVVSATAYFLLQYFIHHLELERARSNRLLLNILPASIAERLKAGEGVIADGFDEATVLFADIVGFTPLAAALAPRDVVLLLDDVFSRFDALAEKHGLEKIKTLGDGYLAVGGIPTPRPDHADAIADLALDLRDTIGEVETPIGQPLAIRIGIDSGPIVAGVIGTTKFGYDLWGDTVNTASRMQSHATPGDIQVTDRVYRQLRDRYLFQHQGLTDVKGKGHVETHLLVARMNGTGQPQPTEAWADVSG